MSTAKDFLYNRKGPWPQPAPDHPLGEAPAVLHLPFAENFEFNFYIGRRYLTDILTYWPVALKYALTHQGLQKVDDSEMGSIIENSLFAKLLNPQLDSQDKKTFRSFLKNNAKTVFYKVDLTAMKFVSTYRGLYAAPTVSLFKRGRKNQLEIVAIFIDDQIVVPSQGDTWELAKYFVLNGCAVVGTLVIHPLLHFPFDSINAITKTALPTKHLLFRLLKPHLRFTLPLDNAALHDPATILAHNKERIYGPYPGPKVGLKELFVAGYKGIEGNSSYPEYSYPMSAPNVIGPYGDFLRAYYETVFKFVSSVVSYIPKNDMDTRRWAKYIAPWIAGFPDDKTIFKNDNLARAITAFIWNVCVAHSLDHKSFGDMNINKVPMRLRQAPPAQNFVGRLNRKSLVKVIDTMKFEMAMKMFYRQSNITLLKDVDYEFTEGPLLAAYNDFLENLRVTNASVEKRFMALDEIAASIQY